MDSWVYLGYSSSHICRSPSLPLPGLPMEPGNPPATTAEVSRQHLQQMGQRLSHVRRWIDHLVAKVRKLGDENSMLREIVIQQAKQIERLQEGTLVGQPLPSRQLPGTDKGTPGCVVHEEGVDMPPVQGDTPGSPCVGYRYPHEMPRLMDNLLE